jgi:putative DNA primase/helicase
MPARIEDLARFELDAERYGSHEQVTATATTICMADVQPKQIQWLWAPRIAMGKLSIIAGDPGLGKSMLTTSLAAHVTTARAWPDGSNCPLGSVILVSGEDDPGDTIRPRLDAAGANVSRVHSLECVKDNGRERGFTLADVVPLAGLLDRIGDCKLIVIDPVSAYLAGTDSHKNSDIRALLTPLAQMAAGHGVAIVAVSHLNKSQAGNALSRVTGSLAFVAAARAAYVVARCPDDPARRLVLPIKNNLGNDRTGLAYRIAEDRGVPYVVWEREPVTMTADEALAPMQDAPRSARDDARDFLTEILSREPVAVDEVRAQGKNAGFTWPTLRRAKDDLGVKSKKGGFGKAEWTWYLPLSKQLAPKVLTPADTSLSTYGESEHLCGSPASIGAIDAQASILSTYVNREHLCAESTEAEYAGRRG